MKKIGISVIISFLFIGYLIGQDDFIKSAEYISYKKSLEKFYDSIAPALLAKLSDKPIVRFVEDFSLGYGGCVISIDKDSLGIPKLTTHCFTFNKKLFKRTKTSIIENSMYISPEFSELVRKLFELAIYQIKYVEKSSCVLDGFTYYFLSTNSNGSPIIAETSNPAEGTNVSNIISICNQLTWIKSDEIQNTATISKEITNLLNQLK